MTPAEFAQKLVDWVATMTQLDPEKGELANVDDWRRNAEKLFALAVGATKPRPMPAYLARFPAGPVAREWQGDPPPPTPVPRLSTRARKVLATLSIAEPRDVAGLKRLDFLKVRGCGVATLAEVIAWAGEHGAHLNERSTKRGERC